MRYTTIKLTTLMNGYPPWYRERVVCAHGPSMPVSTGTSLVEIWLWLSDLQTVTVGKRWPSTLFHIRPVDKQTSPITTERRELRDSHQSCTLHDCGLTGSGVGKCLPGHQVPGGSISQLDATQCTFAMTLFNGLVYSDADIQSLRPILAPVLQAVSMDVMGLFSISTTRA